MPTTATHAQIRLTERWFVRQGAPSMIEGYGFRAHVLPRMLPSLALVAAASLAWLVPLRSEGSERWVLLGAVIVVAAIIRVAMTAASRRVPIFSRTTTFTVLAAYAAMPIVVPLLQFAVDGAVTPPGGRMAGVLGFVIFFAAAFGATLLVTAYGLGALLRRAIRHTIYDLRNSMQLIGRALPALLFVTLFLFFTGELWQAMDRLDWWRLALVVALFGAITVLATATRLRDEIGRVEQDLRPPRLAEACLGTPLARVPVEDVARDGSLPAVPLNGRQNRNLLLMLATRQLVQAAVVGAGIFAFFLILGVLVVVPDTAEQWIGAPPAYVAGVPVALLRNAILFAGFGSMYFAVTSMSDTDHRRQFFAPILNEVERVLAVRAVYLMVRGDSPTATTADPSPPGLGNRA